MAYKKIQVVKESDENVDHLRLRDLRTGEAFVFVDSRDTAETPGSLDSPCIVTVIRNFVYLETGISLEIDRERRNRAVRRIESKLTWRYDNES